MSKQSRMTVGKYLVKRLEEIGVKHVFGVPGDYVLGFMDLIVQSDMEFVGTCNELNAGYAADAYTRVNRVGAVCVTYAVGGFSLLNAVAGAYAERVPLIVISGGPDRADRRSGLLLHHTLGDYDAQADIFAKVTEASVILMDAVQAPGQIDATIAAGLRHKRPVFIELPSDIVNEPCAPPRPRSFEARPSSDRDALNEAVEETLRMLGRAKRPAILAGVEIHRFRIRRGLEALINTSGYPFATTLLAKSLITEQHPQYIGIYGGALSEDYVRKTIENADCLLSLGAIMSDVNLGIYTAKLDERKLINANSDRVKIRYHHFHDVYLKDFIAALRKKISAPKGKARRIIPASRALTASYRSRPDKPITVARFFERMNHFLGKKHIVLADAGDSFLCASELVMHERIGFICQAFYCSIGFTLPAALGVGLADPKRRPVVLIGDGAFQMTGNELSTIIRKGVRPIIFLMNNDGYTIERIIHDGPFNDIQPWKYHRLPEVYGDAWSVEVRTEGELEEALDGARKRHDTACFIEVHIDRLDCSPALKRLGRLVRKRSELGTTFDG